MKKSNKKAIKKAQKRMDKAIDELASTMSQAFNILAPEHSKDIDGCMDRTLSISVDDLGVKLTPIGTNEEAITLEDLNARNKAESEGMRSYILREEFKSFYAENPDMSKKHIRLMDEIYELYNSLKITHVGKSVMVSLKRDTKHLAPFVTRNDKYKSLHSVLESVFRTSSMMLTSGAKQTTDIYNSLVKGEL